MANLKFLLTSLFFRFCFEKDKTRGWWRGREKKRGRI